jgi:tRNA(Ile)-lysidine synthase
VSTAEAAPVSAAEAETLFGGLGSAAVLLLAISGGPDSTALLVLAARWRAAHKKGPELLAVTVDHGLRPESAREARAVKRLAGRLGVRHRTLRWTGRKPATGLQEAARAVRYRLLAAAARGAGAGYVLTGHTLDDQAETVLLRLARGSGLSGLAAMARAIPLDGLLSVPARAKRKSETKTDRRDGITLVRPLLDVPKTRLLATLESIGISFVDDPSNRDPRFTRVRLRGLLPALAGEGLDARRLALLAGRIRRAEATIEFAVDAAAAAISHGPWSGRGPIVLDAAKFIRLPDEVALRLLGRAVARTGDEGPVQLGKLEALYVSLANAGSGGQVARIRRTLAGALVTLAGDRLTVERAPPRAGHRSRTLTTRPYGRRSVAKPR